EGRRRSLRARKPLRLGRERAERGKHAGGGHQHGAGNHPRSKTFAKGTAKQTAGSAAKNPTRSFSCVHGMPPPAKKHTEPKGPANKRKRLTAEARPTSLGGKPSGLPPDRQRKTGSRKRKPARFTSALKRRHSAHRANRPARATSGRTRPRSFYRPTSKRS